MKLELQLCTLGFLHQVADNPKLFWMSSLNPPLLASVAINKQWQYLYFNRAHHLPSIIIFLFYGSFKLSPPPLPPLCNHHLLKKWRTESLCLWVGCVTLVCPLPTVPPRLPGDCLLVARVQHTHSLYKPKQHQLRAIYPLLTPVLSIYPHPDLPIPALSLISNKILESEV